MKDNCVNCSSDYLTREVKLQKITDFQSIAGISKAKAWQPITPDDHGDWLKQRDDSFNEYIVLGDKKGDAPKLFDNYSQGVVTSRDAWCYNAAEYKLGHNMTKMIEFYNSEVDRFERETTNNNKSQVDINSFINSDPTKISWSVNLKQDLVRGRNFSFNSNCVTQSLYRPYSKQWLYFNRTFNERVLQLPRIFPQADSENRVIMTKGNWRGLGQFAIMTDCIPCLQPDGGGQCFPLYLYDKPDADAAKGKSKNDDNLFNAPSAIAADADKPSKKPTRREAITDEGLAHFHTAYPGHEKQIRKQDIFYYVYGLLHSPDYRERYSDNLSKELPRIPCVKTFKDFEAFTQAGRDLAELHLNYETVKPYPATIQGDAANLTAKDYRVTKMKFVKKGKDKDLTQLIYNAKITLKNIPPEAYDYVVNGKPALDWVVERQCVKTDKASGIVNDANDWAVETMENPRYPLDLFLRVVTVSLDTMKIVNNLPKLDI